MSVLPSNLPEHPRNSRHKDFAHVVQFYTDDAFLLDGVASFVGDSLAAGESAISVVFSSHADALLQRLESRGIDFQAAMRDGRFLLHDARELLASFIVAGAPDRSRFMLQAGSLIRQAERAADVKNKRVAIFGEAVALLWLEKKFDAAIQLERLWNELARTHFFHLRCGYPVKAGDTELKGEPYATICAEHSIVIPCES